MEQPQTPAPPPLPKSLRSLFGAMIILAGFGVGVGIVGLGLYVVAGIALILLDALGIFWSIVFFIVSCIGLIFACLMFLGRGSVKHGFDDFVKR